MYSAPILIALGMLCNVHGASRFGLACVFERASIIVRSARLLPLARLSSCKCDFLKRRGKSTTFPQPCGNVANGKAELRGPTRAARRHELDRVQRSGAMRMATMARRQVWDMGMRRMVSTSGSSVASSPPRQLAVPSSGPDDEWRRVTGVSANHSIAPIHPPPPTLTSAPPPACNSPSNFPPARSNVGRWWEV